MGGKLTKSESSDSTALQHVQNPNELNRNSALVSRLVCNEQSRNVWKKHILKTHKLCDPRSPNPELNRTPLIIEDNSEKTFNLDDTFADLFAESKVKSNLKPSSQSENKVHVQKEQSFENTDNGINNYEHNDGVPSVHTPHNPTKSVVTSQQAIDPRSPSIEVKRTPICFNIDNDYDDTIEDVMLENILSALSLNITNNMSFTDNMESFVSHHSDTESLTSIRENVNSNIKIKQSSSLRNIYEDDKNIKKAKIKIRPESGCVERTPLSCVRNRLGSRSLDQFRKLKNHTPKILFKSSKENLNALNVMENS